MQIADLLLEESKQKREEEIYKKKRRRSMLSVMITCNHVASALLMSVGFVVNAKFVRGGIDDLKL